MDLNALSPYIRIAMYSSLPENWVLSKRVIYDYELIYVQSGSCIITVNDVEYLCDANKVVFLRPGIPHSFHVCDLMQFSQPHIHFDAIYNDNSTITPISFKDRPQMTEQEIKLISHDFFSDIPIPVVFEPEDPKEFKRCFFELINVYKSDSSDTIRLKSLMLEIIRLIINQFTLKDSMSYSRQSRKLLAVKEFVDSNHMRDLSLDEIASLFSFNKFSLIRAFKKEFGETVISYYNSKKSETACSLLLDTALSIKEISDLLGFSDEYTFSRFFKNKNGNSPTIYRPPKKTVPDQRHD